MIRVVFRTEVSPRETMLSMFGLHCRSRLRVTVIVLLLWRTTPGSAEEVHFFRIGAAATAGSFFEIGGVLASAISKPADSAPCEEGGSCGVPGLVAVAQATEGSVQNLRMVAFDQMESGIAQSDVVSWAFAGKGVFAEEGPLTKLRAIASLFPENLHVVVRADGPIQTLRDLKRRRISLGQTGSGTLADARIVLAASGLTEQNLSAEYLRSGTAAADLASGSLDGFFLIGGVPIPAVRALAATTPIRLIQIPEDVLLKMQQKYGSYDRSIIPADTYPGVDVATSTVGFHALWVVSVDASEPLIYAITRALWNGATQRLLDAHDPIGKDVRLEHALDGLSVPLHPGAMRFYRQVGLPIQDTGPPGAPD